MTTDPKQTTEEPQEGQSFVGHQGCRPWPSTIRGRGDPKVQASQIASTHVHSTFTIHNSQFTIHNYLPAIISNGFSRIALTRMRNCAPCTPSKAR